MLIIQFEDREYKFDKNAITVDEWRELKRKYRMTPKQFDDCIGEADPDASTFLYWVILRQSGNQAIPLGDQLKPDIIALNAAVAAALDDEENEAEPDPTQDGSRPDGSTPGLSGSSPRTSARSAASTSSSSQNSAASAPSTSDG
jgi:hypothetical protein